MPGVIPFNRKTSSISDCDDFYFILDGRGSLTADSVISRNTFNIDVKETDCVYVIEAELPGVAKEEIDLRVENQYLYICVLRDAECGENDYISKERCIESISSISRRVWLGDAKNDNIDATLKDGILSITIPRDKDSRRSHKITIR